jgi:hypothetical protein
LKSRVFPTVDHALTSLECLPVRVFTEDALHFANQAPDFVRLLGGLEALKIVELCE